MEENSKNQELLDPNVCKGSEFLPNILESLGVSTTITRNGAVMNRLQLDFNVFFGQNNMDLGALGLHPTEADIEAVRNTIQKNA